LIDQQAVSSSFSYKTEPRIVGFHGCVDRVDRRGYAWATARGYHPAMKDPRFSQLAKVLVHHSSQVKSGDKVLIEAFDIPTDFTVEVIKTVADAGGVPIVSTYQQPVLRALFNSASEAQMQFIAQIERARMEGVQCYIGARGSHNISEYADVAREKMDLYERHWWKKVHTEVRVPKTRWVVLRWPHPSMAQAASMSTEAFEDFYFRVCAGVDYGKMRDAMKPLEDWMRKTDQVHITGRGTDLRFSIKNIGVVGCWGERNIPDGECFTCPVRDSINGVIQYNCETMYRGTVFNNIRLEFKNGIAVTASADSQVGTEKLNEILDSDEGARYIGEFAIGFNREIREPMRDILFDEKIAGSFHLTPGQAYEEADNGNKSQIHWDMVCIQRPDYGGGEIKFDGKLIRKDGLFTLPELAGLNPERLGK
jgi:aminopeptidase